MTDRGERAEMTPREAMLQTVRVCSGVENPLAITDAGDFLGALEQLGYVLAPLEATGDMCGIGYATLENGRANVDEIYRAMLASRPK